VNFFFSFMGWGETESPLGTSATNRPTVSALDDRR
jgi:hypothetical protein